tara:strand:- start:10464 stop:11000 length:537 start_codon:yes stop_codon:yes gene_type:complete
MPLFRLLLLCLFIAPSLLSAAEVREIDWLDLLPAEDYQAMLDMPDLDHGNGPDANGDFTNSLRQENKNLPEVMYSTRVVAEMDQQQLRIGGYPVPIETDAKGRYTQFFLVPYAGACIHVPPPPPNQIILVDYPAGMDISDIYQPLWVQGLLRVAQSSNALADASYQLDAEDVGLYDGP